MSATSSFTRATAAGHIFVISAIAASGSLRHLFLERPVRKRRVALQLRPLGAQLQDFGDDFVVVVGISVVASAVVGAPDFLAQVTAVE